MVKQLSNLKEEAGQPLLVVGSSDLAQTLIQYDLIDEYQLWLHPVVLGSGKRLFRENDGVRTLRLIDSRTTAGGGLVILTYGT